MEHKDGTDVFSRRMSATFDTLFQDFYSRLRQDPLPNRKPLETLCRKFFLAGATANLVTKVLINLDPPAPSPDDPRA